MSNKHFVQPSKTSKTHIATVEAIPASVTHAAWAGKTEWAATACGSVFSTDLLVDGPSAKGLCAACARAAQ